MIGLVGGVVGLLLIASVVGYLLARTVTGESGRKTVSNLNARVRAWWWMALIFGLALATGRAGPILLFGLLSFLALREFITLAPTRPGDHRTLFWVFFVITPLQYLVLW